MDVDKFAEENTADVLKLFNTSDKFDKNIKNSDVFIIEDNYIVDINWENSSLITKEGFEKMFNWFTYLNEYLAGYFNGYYYVFNRKTFQYIISKNLKYIKCCFITKNSHLCDVGSIPDFHPTKKISLSKDFYLDMEKIPHDLFLNKNLIMSGFSNKYKFIYLCNLNPETYNETDISCIKLNNVEYRFYDNIYIQVIGNFELYYKIGSTNIDKVVYIYKNEYENGEYEYEIPLEDIKKIAKIINLN